jgi:hypothetical protein
VYFQREATIIPATPRTAYVPWRSRYDVGFAPPTTADAEVALYTITIPNAVSASVTSVRTCHSGFLPTFYGRFAASLLNSSPRSSKFAYWS